MATALARQFQGPSLPRGLQAPAPGTCSGSPPPTRSSASVPFKGRFELTHPGYCSGKFCLGAPAAQLLRDLRRPCSGPL